MAVSVVVTPKLNTGEECTVAFANIRGYDTTGGTNQNGRPLNSFRNLMVGYASQTKFGVIHCPSAASLKIYKFGLIGAGLLATAVFLFGLSWFLLIPAAAVAFTFTPYFYRFKAADDLAIAAKAKLIEMRFKDNISVVYS